jgi:predicted dehydrogenase
MGRFHRRALRDLGFEVYAVDPDLETGAEFRTIIDARLNIASYDVAVVATPIPELVGAAFQLAGTKMLVEKPFAPTAQTASMLGAYLERQGPVGVGYVERFNPEVRRLRAETVRRYVINAKFTRHGARPSDNIEVDLLAHDLDLAHYLGIPLKHCEFDTHDSQEERVRRIEIEFNDLKPLVLPNHFEINLMDHDTSPLHAMWHAFLTDSEHVARPADAVRVLAALEARRAEALAA